MVVVAIAGGTGDVGKAVVEELVFAGKHEVVVLTRRLPDGPTSDRPKFLAIDYTDVNGMAQALQNHNVHTVVCAMSIEGPAEQSQLNLIAAADQSSTTQRFIPSEFAAYTPGGDPNEADEMTAPILRTRVALSKTGLETTHIASGVFMDYFGQPSIPSTLRPMQWAIDVPSRRAAIPGTGNEIITLTYSKDLARFVGCLIGDQNWPKFSNISGSDTSLNEIVAIAEKITGEKFHVTYDSAEDINIGKATPISPNAATYNGIDPAMMAVMMGKALIDGLVQIPKEHRLNDHYTHINPMAIEEMMRLAWSSERM